jgi:molybdate transport system substrate-binding protein
MIPQKLRRNWIFLVLFLFITLSSYIFVSQRQLANSDDIIVSAAISVGNALEDIQSIYESSSDSIITYNLAASGKLRQQIEQGAPVDIYISAGKNYMDILEAKNLILGTGKNLLKNRLGLIIPETPPNPGINKFEDLLKPEIQRIAIGEPRTVPAGDYAAELLTNLGIYQQLESKLVFGNNVRQVLTFVETGNVDAGIVYLTDAKFSQNVTLIQIAPENLHSPIIYPIAVVKSSKNVEYAEDYMQFLFSKTAQSVFEKYGFTVVNEMNN